MNGQKPRAPWPQPHYASVASYYNTLLQRPVRAKLPPALPSVWRRSMAPLPRDVVSTRVRRAGPGPQDQLGGPQGTAGASPALSNPLPVCKAWLGPSHEPCLSLPVCSAWP